MTRPREAFGAKRRAVVGQYSAHRDPERGEVGHDYAQEGDGAGPAFVRLHLREVLARQFEGWDINRAWVSDVIYLSTVEGWLYLAVIMDLASRQIVGWSMGHRLHADLVCQGTKGELLAAQTGAGADPAFRPRQPG